MKLRIRSVETKETQKIEVPSSCTLQELKHRVSQALPSSSSSSNSIHLSLNRKDELQGVDETVQSFGITSGDLVFFTFQPNGFSISPQTHIPKSQPGSTITQKPETVKNMDTHENKTLNPIPVALGEEPEEFMEVDCSEMKADVDLKKSFSVPGFLRKVFTEELSDDGGVGHKLLVVAVHAVFVESGFVILDPVSFTELSGSQFWKAWSLGVSRMTLFYTLPEVVNCVKSGCSNVVHTVELKFQCLGKFFIAHGMLSGGVSTCRVTLNEDQLVPFLNVVWANCGLHEEVTGREGEVVPGTSPEREVFQFWRNVKDGLVLPLLIDLCDKAGLELPPCFTRLPTELKLKIVELLPSVQLAKMSCVSSELRYLCSSDDLWKKKFVEQFGDGVKTSGGHWKEKFVEAWEGRKRRKLITSRRTVLDPLGFLGGPHPFGRPRIIGGDYDLFPQPFDNPLGRAPRSRRLPNHVPRCHLGGHRSNNLI